MFHKKRLWVALIAVAGLLCLGGCARLHTHLDGVETLPIYLDIINNAHSDMVVWIVRPDSSTRLPGFAHHDKRTRWLVYPEVLPVNTAARLVVTEGNTLIASEPILAAEGAFIRLEVFEDSKEPERRIIVSR